MSVDLQLMSRVAYLGFIETTMNCTVYDQFLASEMPNFAGMKQNRQCRQYPRFFDAKLAFPTFVFVRC
jgi:hypothetical protein